MPSFLLCTFLLELQEYSQFWQQRHAVSCAQLIFQVPMTIKGYCFQG